MEMIQDIEYSEHKQEANDDDYQNEQAEVPVVVEQEPEQQSYQPDGEFVGEIEPEPVLVEQDPNDHQVDKEESGQPADGTQENMDHIDLEELQKIQCKMPPADPEAPVGSSKNPIRIVQQGNQYITTQDVSEDHLQQIIQVLTNQALLQKSTSKPSAIYNRNTNKRIIFRVTRGKRRKPEPEKDPEEEEVKPVKQELFDNPFKRENDEELDEEEEDPDFEPELPEEEILPFPLIRRKASSGRQVKPPKHLVKDYKHLKIEELNAEESSDDNNSDVGYADYSGAENSQEDENNEKEFVCEICQLGFDTKAGLARHKGVKHGGDFSFQKNRWSNPYMASVRRRNKLQEAVAAATDDDLIEFVAPRLAKILSPWDHLLMRSEQGDPPLPHVPGLVFEYLSLADQARAFLAEHLSSKGKTGAKDSMKKGDNDFNKENEGDNDNEENPDQVIVRIDNNEESGALGLPIGRYVVESPLKEEFLPRRFRSVLASQRIAQARKEEEARLRGRFDFDRGSGMYEEDKRGIVGDANEDGKGDGYYETVHDPGFGDDLLLMTEGGLGFPVPDAWLQSGAYLAVLTETGLQSDLVMEASTGKLYHKPTGHLVSLGGVTSLAEAAEGEEVQEDAMMDVDIPQEVTQNRQVVESQTADNSQTQEEIQEEKQEQVEITEGQPITQVLDDETQQFIDIESAFPGVTITEISHGVCMIAKPNGTQFQVEHGGDGITLATLQEVLALDDQE